MRTNYCDTGIHFWAQEINYQSPVRMRFPKVIHSPCEHNFEIQKIRL